MQEKKTPNNKKKNFILLLLALFFILLGIGYAIYYNMYAKFYKSTDNAYVQQNIIYVTPQISATVKKVFVQKMQYVKQGQTLATLDESNIKLAYEKAKITLANKVREVSRLYKQKASIQASLELAIVRINKAKKDLRREKTLKEQKAISENTYNNYKFIYDKAFQNKKIIQAKVQELQAVLKNDDIYQNPQILQSANQLKQNYLNLLRCNITAPESGVIAQKRLNKGEYVTPASTLFAIIPQKGFWVDANFKETQLKYIKIGQKVKLYSDLYGNDVVYHGKVIGINPATGAVFSLLPAQNATGNWIKIVQRIPVRISLNKKELKKHPLHIGSSMQVTVDLHNQKGDIYIQDKVQKSLKSNELYKDFDKNIQIIIDKIIQQNI